MEDKNMTALMSLFIRAYHNKNNKCTIFSDSYAEIILSDEEYNTICSNLCGGINFFNPSFVGNDEEALRWIVNNYLGGSVLGRSAFCEKSLFNAIKMGCSQYLIFASGYDTFGYRNKNKSLKVFEIDRKEMIDDKIKRLKSNNIPYSDVNYISTLFPENNWISLLTKTGYVSDEISFCSLLGISYYLKKEDFSSLICDISSIVCCGSSILFDYPTFDECDISFKNEKLADGASEGMKSKYSYNDIESILSDNGFLIYEHLNKDEMNCLYFKTYNLFNPDNKFVLPDGVNYCLAVKK